jgi:hypothetical protein
LFALALVPLLALGEPAPAPPDAGTKSLRAVRTTNPIALDGKLDDAGWALASAVTDFTQLTPLLGTPSTKRTEVRVLYDDDFLYVGARMHHPPGRADIVRRVHRRDESSASDWFALFLDSVHDHRSAFSFMVNAANVQRDGLHFEDQSDDWSWDGVWESAVSVDGDGWTAELAIPLSLLRFHNGEEPLVWGINFGRRDEGRDREVCYWHVPDRSDNAWVSRFNHLVGLEGLKPRLRRELVPYFSVQRKFETAQGWDDREWSRRLGLDAHFGISSSSQLDLTVRPDFGQVEVDRAVLNLSTVETFFPEKRPFFLEGMEIFQLPGIALFYSRRIGKGLDPPGPAEGVVDWPMAVDIAAAAKLTAKLPGGLAVGMLGAGLEAARGTVLDESGVERKEELSPYANVAVGRVTQSLDDRGSYVGLFGSSLREAGGAGRSALVGALDGVWRSPDRSTRIEGLLAHSDAGPKDGGTTGDLLRLHLVSALGGGWNLDGNAFNVSKGFDPNDLGYLDRPDRKGFTFDLDRNWDIQSGVFRNPFLRITYCDFRDQEGKAYTQYVESWAKTELTSDWSVYAGGGVMSTVYDDLELRTFGDPVKKYLRIPSAQWAFLGVDSPPNSLWVLNFLWHPVWREGGMKHELQLAQSIKPVPRLEVELETGYTTVAGEWHWLETQGETPIVGTRSLEQLDQVVRVSWAFSPTLTLQLFSQWLAASWSFRDLRSYVDDRTLAPGATATVPLAYSDRLWSLHALARWEFRPGSSLYLVYTHGAWTDDPIGDHASLRPWRDLEIMNHLPSDDAIQLKLGWLFR